MQVMGIVQALSPKPKLHAAFPPIPDNCLTTENAEGTEETRKRKLSVISYQIVRSVRKEGQAGFCLGVVKNQPVPEQQRRT